MLFRVLSEALNEHELLFQVFIMIVFISCLVGIMNELILNFKMSADNC